MIGKRKIFHHIKKTGKSLNNKLIALNVSYIPYNTDKIRHGYKSKYNKERENQANLLMITDGKKMALSCSKKLSVLLRGVTSNHVGEFYCLNCFHSYSTDKNVKNIIMYAKVMIIVM